MTAQDKAKELIDKFKHHTRAFNEITGWEDYLHCAKACALIAVDEVINTITNLWGGIKEIEYWQRVKQEIVNL